MTRIALLALAVFLSGCETTLSRVELEPIESARRVNLARPVTIVEKRGPLALELQWQLLPGVYMERYQSPLGRVYESEGPLVEFTPTVGGKTQSVGGFIVLRDKKGVGKLYVVRKGETVDHYGPMGTALGKMLVGPAGNLSLVTDFPLSRLREARAK